MYDKTELLIAKTSTLMVIAQTQAAAQMLPSFHRRTNQCLFAFS